MNVTVVVPVYNEVQALALFWQEVQPIITACPNVNFSWLFVNDGSTDGSWGWLKTLASQYTCVQAISLSRNFGKEAAVTAGITYAASHADAVIIIDVDLQDPPSLIPAFIQKWQEGFDVVYGVRTNRQTDSWFKRVTATLFYKGYNLLSAQTIVPHAGDCRLLSRQAVDALLALPERERFMKGLFNWIGFKSVGIPFIRQPRITGKSKWNYWQLWNFALQGLTAGSTVLLRLWAYIGILISVLAVLFAVWIAFKKIMYGNPVSGYTSLMVTILFCSGIQLISLGILGEYISRIFIESKHRPLFLIDEKINC